MGVRVKICGVTSAADAREAAALGADMIGFNFWPGSKRAVAVADARLFAASLPAAVWRVGVFVNASRDEIARTVAEVGLDAIQLHGDEPDDLLRGWPCRVIRVVRLSSADDSAARRASEIADYVLCEGRAGGGYGGAGETFPWEWAGELPRERLIVAGGLHPGNVAEAVRRLQPFAVDVASGVERSAGVKDVRRMAELIENAKAA
jgi:phosphoribosylanthranilate isomerase